jgi:hypothetical protein
MSRLKIGSVMDAVSENGTRFCHSSTVSHAVASEPATPSANSTVSPASTHVASGPRFGRSSVDQVTLSLGRRSRPGS